jgi:endoglucanase
MRSKKVFSMGLTKINSLILMIMMFLVVGTSTVAFAAKSQVTYEINIWWPTSNAQLTGQQPFMAELKDMPVDNYKMYWSVDNGGWNHMPSSYNNYPHKEAVVDVNSWNWKGSGPYVVTYIATGNAGKKLAQKSVSVQVNSETAATTSTVTEESPATTADTQTTNTNTIEPTTSTANNVEQSSNPLNKFSLYVQPGSNAERQAQEWRFSRPADAATMDRLAAQPVAKWLGGWNQNIENDTRSYIDAARQSNKLPVVVAYNIPQRDCGSYSAGGSSSGEAYLEWIRAVARGIGSNPAVIILEPDAVSGMDCLNSTDKSLRIKLLTQAIAIIKQQPAAVVYIDAGHARWHGEDEMAARLQSVNIAKADGFSLNVSNFLTTQENTDFGSRLSAKLGGKHFVVDTSRNGAGPTADSQWCNPTGRALGQAPTTNSGTALVDAYLWIKTPGESDGTCNGGPSAGSWWAEYALGLAKTAGW